MNALILKNLNNLWHLDNKCACNNEIPDELSDCELNTFWVQEVLLIKESIETIFTEYEPF